MRLVFLASLLLCSACNVFLGLDSVESNAGNDGGTTTAPPNNTVPAPLQCTDSCTCNRNCDVDCAGCEITCQSDAACAGAIAGGGANCAKNATCSLSCTANSCDFACTDRNSNCFVDCADPAECLMDCGPSRNPGQRDDCVFVNCASPTECGDGIFVCNRECPL